MRIVKRAAVVLLLLALSVAAVFGPHWINAYSVQQRLSHTEYWQYTGTGGRKLTGAQVVDLYIASDRQNGSIVMAPTDDSQAVSGSEREQDAEAVRQSVQQLLRSVLGGDESVLKFFIHTAEGVCDYYGRSYLFSVQDGTATVLSFVNVYFEQEDGTALDITFEEKTGTLIRMVYFGMPDKVPNRVFPDARAMLEDYYDNTLGVSRAVYRCRLGLSDGAETAGFVECRVLTELEQKMEADAGLF